MNLPLKTVLVADDDKGIRDLLERALTEHGYRVVEAVSDGREAVRRVKASSPQMAILDIAMSGMDGLEAVRQIIAAGTTAVVILTGDTDIAGARSAMEAGVAAYVLKPFDLTQLVATLETAWHHFVVELKLRQELRQLQETLETRKLLDKAKGILMEQQGFSEEEAHKTILKMSQDQGIAVKELCRSLIQVRMVLGSKPKTVPHRKAA